MSAEHVVNVAQGCDYRWHASGFPGHEASVQHRCAACLSAVDVLSNSYLVTLRVCLGHDVCTMHVSQSMFVGDLDYLEEVDLLVLGLPSAAHSVMKKCIQTGLCKPPAVFECHMAVLEVLKHQFRCDGLIT